MICYTPRLPADPLIRRMYTLLRMLAPCRASALSRYHPGWDPTPRTSPPGIPPGTHPPTPTHPTPRHPIPPHPPLVRVEGYSKWMVIPSGWLFRVDGYSECMVGLFRSHFSSKFESNKQGYAQTQPLQKTLTASMGHCTSSPVTVRHRF